MENPWSVPSFGHFLFFNCPECDYRNCDERQFYEHSIGSHVQAVTTFEIDEPKSVENLTLKDFHARFFEQTDIHTEEIEVVDDREESRTDISDHQDDRIDTSDHESNAIETIKVDDSNEVNNEQEIEIVLKIFKCHKCKIGYETKEDLYSHFRTDFTP